MPHSLRLQLGVETGHKFSEIFSPALLNKYHVVPVVSEGAGCGQIVQGDWFKWIIAVSNTTKKFAYLPGLNWLKTHSLNKGIKGNFTLFLHECSRARLLLT